MFAWFDKQAVLGGPIAMMFAVLLSVALAAPASAQATSEEQLRAEVTQHREAAAALDRETDPVAWAVAQTELANRLYMLWDHDSMTEAAALYRAALEILTPEATPAEWLRAEEGLGDALLQIGSRRMMASAFGMLGGSWTDPGDDSRDAALAFRAALGIRNRESDPIGWARLQIKLGYALTTWTTRQRIVEPENTETDAIQGEAESAFRQALDAVSLRENPQEWAWANEGLAMLYSEAAMFIGQEYVEDEAALRRSEARRVPYVRAAMASIREAERAYRHAGDHENAQDMRLRLQRLREDLRPNRIIPNWLQ